jgi:RimJ/RimL family protein N-acetyltransferase
MELETLTREQVQLVRLWRNEELNFLRTPYPITEQMQNEFYDNVVNNRESKHRYFAIMEENECIGMCGLTNIEWENGTAEISLIINPDYRGKGHGKKSVSLLLEEAFYNMRLLSVFGEVYNCGNRGFWEKLVNEKKGYKTELKHRKYHNGQMYDSMWFSFTREVI